LIFLYFNWTLKFTTANYVVSWSRNIQLS
jgi:hypothetical protein